MGNTRSSAGSTRSRRRRWRRRKGERGHLTTGMDIPIIPRVAVDLDIWIPDGRELLPFVCSRRLTSLLQEVVAFSKNILTICKTELNLIPFKSSVFDSSIIFNLIQLP